MKPDRLEALLWERIDGVISAVDRAELDAWLAGNSQARELDRELIALAARLEESVELEPPAELRPRIDRALAAARPPAAAKSKRIQAPYRAPSRDRIGEITNISATLR